MTIIVGIKCTDGVVIASDSQQEFGRGVAVKRLNTGKIYIYNNQFAIAGAGTLAHIEKAVGAIKFALGAAKKRKGGVELSENECTDAIEKSVTAVYKEYNIDRAKFLGEPREKNFFTPILICGGLGTIDGKSTPCLFIVHSEGIVENVFDYATAGSGAAYAELILKDLCFQNMMVKEGIAAAVYTIEEVKNIDPNCGGDTRVSVVWPDKKSVQELDTAQIIGLFNKVKPVLDMIRKNIVPKILGGELNEEELRKILERRQS